MEQSNKVVVYPVKTWPELVLDFLFLAAWQSRVNEFIVCQQTTQLLPSFVIRCKANDLAMYDSLNELAFLMSVPGKISIGYRL